MFQSLLASLMIICMVKTHKTIGRFIVVEQELGLNVMAELYFVICNLGISTV